MDSGRDVAPGLGGAQGAINDYCADALYQRVTDQLDEPGGLGSSLLSFMIKRRDAISATSALLGLGVGSYQPGRVGGSADPVAAADPAATRVTLRVGTKAEIRLNAPKTASGDFIDPNTGAVIPAEGPFDYGHKPGYEWWRTQTTAREENWTREQVIEYENDPSHFQIEDPSSNRSRRYEQIG